MIKLIEKYVPWASELRKVGSAFFPIRQEGQTLNSQKQDKLWGYKLRTVKMTTENVHIRNTEIHTIFRGKFCILIYSINNMLIDWFVGYLMMMF